MLTFLRFAALRDRLGLSLGPLRAPEEHLAAAASWLLRAQAATPDAGVAHSYHILQRKWNASYPETTGYIIPTLIDYAEYFGRPDCGEAAIRMADWEIEVQLSDGGVRAGVVDDTPGVPTIFNTGQVLFGFARAYAFTKDERFATALRRAADWLTAAQDADGAWRKFPSPFTTGDSLKSYNTRSAFGLIRAWQILGETRWRDSAVANARWALSQASENGFLPYNCLVNDKAPLTHTLAYSIRGLLEIGDACGEQQLVDHAVKMSAALAAGQRADGSLAGRYDSAWKPAVRWSCLTGNSQMAINWLRLSRITGDRRFEESAIRANRYNMRAQNLLERDPNRHGGLKGSFPVDGEYMSWRYPNWATKFFADALMLELLPAVKNLG